MAKKNLVPVYIFEASWEVCNRVGGIYTVLSTKAASLSEKFGERLFFIGPDFWQEAESPFFSEEKSEKFEPWLKTLRAEGVNVRFGKWKVSGEPQVLLIDFKPFFARQNEIFGEMWNWFGVDSLHSYGDYAESGMFGYACGKVIESFVKFFSLEKKEIIAHFNEWMTAFGELYLKQNLPSVATVFTTHATSIGRSIAGNGKPLYDFMHAYNGDQMAWELNMEAKHSVEKTAAHQSDAFTTVSEITAWECAQLLAKEPDVVTPNGFDENLMAKTVAESRSRKEEARKDLRKVAAKMLGYELDENALLVCTSGRYEVKNKGLDVLFSAFGKLKNENVLEREIVLFVMVPAYIGGARAELLSGEKVSQPLFSTHVLKEEWSDAVMCSIRNLGVENLKNEKVKILFVPSYLNGDDGVFNKPYYDLLQGFDLSIFPSYYEPWGYTPLEAAAFSVPTITTDLAGFGRWVSAEPQGVEAGVAVIHRGDYNFDEVAWRISQEILNFSKLTKKEAEKVSNLAKKIAQKALWKNFIQHYYTAFSIALNKKKERINIK